MNENKVDKLYQYYRMRAVLPTYAQFASLEDLHKYRKHRETFFRDKLHLPPQIFRNATVVEFGPDSGENSLVFASWGARLTLVEPNPNSWPRIEYYFKNFGLSDRLISLSKVDLEHFESEAKFQFIDAEGFIYTVRPESVWMDLFDRIMEKDGFAVISYMEAFGSLLEFILKVIFRSAGGGKGSDSTKIAWKLFEAKWNSIPHTRSLESWVMDVLENPFVRLNYCFEAEDLYRKLSSGGFGLYSSWPNYLDTSNVYWHKKELPLERRLANDLEYIARSRLSFTFGRSLFICSKSSDKVKSIGDTLTQLLEAVDHLIDDLNVEYLKVCLELLDMISEFLKEETGNVLASQESCKETLQLVESIKHIMELLSQDNANDLAAFCNSNAAFVNSWGMPHHFAVVRRLERDADG